MISTLLRTESCRTTFRSLCLTARFYRTTASLQCKILKSSLPGVQIPEKSSFTEFVFEHFDNYKERIALVDGVTGKSYSFQELKKDVFRISSGLTKLGFKKGDVFAICSPNIPEFIILFHGIINIGGIVTTVNPLATTSELTRQLRLTSAKFLITIPALANTGKEAAAQIGLESVYVVGESDGCLSYNSLLENDGSDIPKDVNINPKEDILALPCSSGTTGLPKAVMLTHYNLISNVLQSTAKRLMDEPSGSVIMGLLPLYHIYGMLFYNGLSLHKGHKVILMPQFIPESFLQNIQEHKVEVAPIVPPIALFLAKDPLVDKYDLSSLNELVSGAAPLGKEVYDELREKFPNIKLIRQGYGLTETSPAVMIDYSDTPKAGSVGVLLPNTEGQVVDLYTGECLGPLKRGEVCVRGPQVMKGYLNNPKETAQTIDSDGWLHTGDIGYYDEDEHFFIVDRLKELIKYKGLQVAPAELEDLLLSHPNIKDVAVIGIPSSEAGELPKAFVVRVGDVTKEDIEDFVAKRVAPYKKLRGGVEFIDAVPKAASGKILRRILKEKYVENKT